MQRDRCVSRAASLTHQIAHKHQQPCPHSVVTYNCVKRIDKSKSTARKDLPGGISSGDVQTGAAGLGVCTICCTICSGQVHKNLEDTVYHGRNCYSKNRTLKTATDNAMHSREQILDLLLHLGHSLHCSYEWHRRRRHLLVCE
jgi:hypothetical protein